MITKKDYKKAVKDMNKLSESMDAYSWFTLIMGNYPDKITQEYYDALSNLINTYEKINDFYELINSGDYRTA